MNIGEISKKITVEKKRFYMRVFVVGIIFSITFFLLLLDFFKEYKASYSILVTPKNETASFQSESIVANIAEFPKMLSFYERLLKFNPQIRDEFSGKSRDERKQLWNEKIEVSVGESEKGSIINLSVFAKSSSQAENLLKKTSRNLFEITSGHYNAKSEVTISIVDGPFVSAVSRKFVVVVAVALIMGFAISFTLNGFLNILEKIVKPYQIRRSVFPDFNFVKKANIFKEDACETLKEDDYSYDVPYNFGDFKKEDFSNENENERESLDIENVQEGYDLENNSYPNYPEMPKTPTKKASAPENLPVVDESMFFGKEATDKEESDKEQTLVEMKKEEPTAEELRDRLNRLLRGDD